jgi:hypothetical protein
MKVPICAGSRICSVSERPSPGSDEDGRIGDGHQQQDDRDGYHRPWLGDRAKVVKHWSSSALWFDQLAGNASAPPWFLSLGRPKPIASQDADS